MSTQTLDFGAIASGVLVDSHYVQFDPVTSTGDVGTGSVTFDGPIVGLITRTGKLIADLSPEVVGTSDSYFGLETLLGPYPTGADPSARGLGSPEDDLIFTLGAHSLTVELLSIPAGGDGNTDAFRVLTLAIDCPGDATGDGFVNLFDFARVSGNLNRLDCVSGNNWCNGADVNLIGAVNLDDVMIVAAHWLESCDIIEE